MDTPRVTHVYSYCNDLAAARAFYEGVLGLPVTVQYDSFIEFDLGVKYAFFLAPDMPVKAAAFSSVPGWQGDGAQAALCAIHCTRPQLDALRDALAAAGARFTEPALRDGAWEMRALDPMGNTVELYAICADAP